MRNEYDFTGASRAKDVPHLARLRAEAGRAMDEKKSHRDSRFDAQPVPAATLADLSRWRFEEDFRHASFSADGPAANDHSYEQRLAATKMIVSTDIPTPTVAGILVLGTRPRDFISSAYVQFLRVAGREWGDPVHDEAVLEGPLGDLVRRVDEKRRAGACSARCRRCA